MLQIFLSFKGPHFHKNIKEGNITLKKEKNYKENLIWN